LKTLTAKQEYDRKRYLERAQEFKARAKKWYQNNKERATENSKRWNSEHPESNHAASARYRKGNPEKRRKLDKAYRQHQHVKEKNRKSAMERRAKIGKDKLRKMRAFWKYGISPEQYDMMFNSQGGKCGLCGEPPLKENVLVVDHDHTDGKVRALIHRKCNSGIGFFDDSSSKLRLAAQYLDFHKGKKSC
jgi:hypothetical protein